MMLTRDNMHNYQGATVEFIKAKKKCAAFLDMGLGKTVSTLTAASDLLDNFEVTKVLVIAPLRVANTVWQQETKKWAHLQHLHVNICTGSAAQRKAMFKADADIYVINRENVPWLIKNLPWVFDMVVVDESSGFKSAKSQRFKALKRVTHKVKVMVELTGTPSPNGLMDLWAQIYLIDNGERLGRTMSNFKMRFFSPSGYMGYEYTLNKGAGDIIKALISDICITMSAEDYLELPPRVDVVEKIILPKIARDQYKEIEKSFVLSLGDDANIEAMSAAALAMKLLQISNGAVYDEDKVTHTLHDEKLKAMRDIIDDNPAENFLVAYNFKSDLARIKKAFPDAVVLSKSGEELADWNAGKIKMLLAHPASAGHGLNAQHGGSTVIWFGLNWSLELYQQFNARLHRQGQTRPVTVVHLVAEGCIDERVMGALSAKAQTQGELLEYLKQAYHKA